MAVHRCPRQVVFLAKLFVAARGITITIAGTILQTATYSFHMMVMAFLGQPNLVLEPKNLFAVFAHLAIHQVLPGFNLIHPVFKRGKNQFVIVKISGLQELDARMPRSNLVGECINAFDQHTGEQKIGKDNNCLLYTSPSPRDKRQSRMPSSA